MKKGDEGSRAAYIEIIQRLVSAGAQGVVLGCTEIELLIRPEHTSVPLFPSTELHARGAVQAAFLADRAVPRS